jgi:glutaredoxin-related protein
MLTSFPCPDGIDRIARSLPRCGYVRVVRQLLGATIKTNATNAAGESAADVAQNEAIRNIIKQASENAAP